MFLGTVLLCFSFICSLSLSKPNIVNNNTDIKGSSGSTISYPNNTVSPSRTSETSTEYVKTLTSNGGSYTGKEFPSQSTFSYSATYIPGTLITGESECAEGPEKVENLNVTEDSHAITLNWTKPSKNDLCITHYVIKWKATMYENSSNGNLTTEEFFVIHGLEACVNYEVSVRAMDNNNNISEPEVRNVTTLTDVPGQVVDLDLKPSTHNVSLKWKKPSNDGECVTHYTISWRHTGSGNTSSTDIAKDEYSYVIGNLDACVEYEISVSAVNENDDKNNTAVNTTTETVVPGQVVDLDLKPSPHNVCLEWKNPSNDGDCVTRYAISWRHTGNENTISNYTGKEENSYVIENLDACVEYEISVSAVNKNGEGNVTTVNTTTVTVVPGQVVDLDLKPSPHNVSLEWKKPSNDGDCVTRYAISWRHTGNENTISNYTGKEENSYVIENLDACVEYEISVSAVNKNGEGNVTTVNTTTVTVVPGQVVDLDLKPSPHNVSLEWKKPSNDGDCVTRYAISWRHTGNENTISNYTGKEENSYVIENLDACVEYEISVSAVNKNGEGNVMTVNTTTVTVVPGQVIDLDLKPSPHNVSLKWKKPSNDGDCVTHYAISWRHTGSENTISNYTGKEENSYVIENLDACVEYEISVSALNKNEEGNVTKVNTTTVTVVPGQVVALDLKPSPHNISLKWKKPSNDGDCVTHYAISWTHTGSENTISNYTGKEEYSYVIENLDACVEYEISVSAVNKNEEGNVTTVNTTTVTVVPGQVVDLDLKPSPHNISLKWKKPSNDGGCVTHYGISWRHTGSENTISNYTGKEEYSFVIGNLDACVEYEIFVSAVNDNEEGNITAVNMRTDSEVTGAPKYEDILCLESEKACLKWMLPDLSSNKCQLQNCTVVCNAVEPTGLPLKNGVSGEFQNDFVVVDVIGLSSSTSYSCVAYITNEGGTSKNGSSTPFTTGPDVPVGVIVGVLSAIIIVGLLAVVFVTYHKGTLVWPPKLFARAKQATVRPQPVLVKKFPEYCVQMLEMPTRLGSEYQLLATLSVDISASSSCVNGQMPENKWKNRYINILPYDDTRVTLDLIDGDPSSHYINASFIKGYSNDIEYIATQGPKEETCLDFWRMVFQHDVSVIVMVTNLVEQDKVKCHQYYPDLRENVVFGDMTIRCTTEVNFPIHTARTLVLVKGDKKRKLSHLHFREWPDFGVPQSTDIMIHFCQTMRHHVLAAEQGLILVHCSAGVGRTGTLIAVDILLQHISENKKVDIFGTVFKLRKQRTNMVQTEGQYKYIYRCIKDAIEDPTIVNPATATNNPLEPIYENVGTSLNSLQYEKLPKWKKKDHEA